MIAILVFAIVFGFWVDCQVCLLACLHARSLAFTVSCTLTHTYAFGLGGGGTVHSWFQRLLLMLNCCRTKTTETRWICFTFSQIHFSSPLASFREADPFGLSNDDDDCGGGSNNSTSGSNNIISVPFHFILESFVSNTPHRCVLHKFWSQVLCTTQALGWWTQTLAHTQTNTIVHLPFSFLAKR